MRCCILFLLPALLLAAGCGQGNDLHLLIGGDLLLDRGIERSWELYGPELLLEDVLPLMQQADATLLNLECPVAAVSDPKNKSYLFRGNPSYLSTLRELGVTHLNVANNHTLDHGQAGFIETLKQLRDAGYGVCGVDSTGCEPSLIVKEDIRVALFATNRVEVDSSVTGARIPRPCQVSIEQLCARIRSYRAAHQDDWIIASLHWGQEYRRATSAQQLGARMLVDAGANVVVGHHPHVVQGYEEYNGALIVYSVGNFLFDQATPETQEGWVLDLTLSSDRDLDWTIHRFLRDNMFGLRLIRGGSIHSNR